MDREDRVVITHHRGAQVSAWRGIRSAAPGTRRSQVNAVLALILVGVLWVAVTRLLERSLYPDDVEVATGTRLEPGVRTWTEIPTNRRIDTFPDHRTAHPYTGT
jgi:hypothetical protein